MRTFGTFLALGFFALTASCGGGSSGGFTSPTGRTASSGGAVCKNQSCAAEYKYYSCLTSTCGTQAQTCFGASYTSGTFSGACAELITCTMACPCDQTGNTCLGLCYAAITADCQTCVTTLSTCTAGAGCQQATCNNDAASTTGTNCVALQACCTKMTDATVKAACQTSITNAGGVDSTCALILQGIQSYCP